MKDSKNERQAQRARHRSSPPASIGPAGLHPSTAVAPQMEVVKGGVGPGAEGAGLQLWHAPPLSRSR